MTATNPQYPQPGQVPPPVRLRCETCGDIETASYMRAGNPCRAMTVHLTECGGTLREMK